MPNRWVVFLAVLVGIPVLCFAGNDQWTTIGPYGGASFAEFAFHPSNSNLIFFNAGYRSLDGGKNWERLDLQPFSEFPVRIDPFDSNSIVTADSNFYRSRDQGRLWKEIAHAPFGTFNGSSFFAFDLEFHSTSPDVLYAIADGHFLKSTDGGKSWREKTSILRANTYLYQVEVDRANGDNVIVLSNQGLHKSSDGGESWQFFANSLTADYGSFRLNIDPSNSQVLYVVTNFGLYKSVDGGINWTPVNCNCEAKAIAIDPQDSNKIYVQAFDAIFRSKDGGNNWARSKLPFRHRPQGIAVHPSVRNLVFTADAENGNVFRSQDAGATWQVFNQGLGPAPVQAIAADPAHPGNMMALLAIYDNDNVVQTTDRGMHWKRVGVLQRIQDIQFHPRNSNLIGAVGFWGLAISKDAGKSWSTRGGPSASKLVFDPLDENTIYIAAYQSDRNLEEGVAKTINQGKKWKLVNTGLPEGEITAITVNPNKSSNLFVATSRTIFESVNSGQDWQKTTANFCCYDIFPIVFSPTNPDVIFASTGDALFKSVDHGSTWDRKTRGLPDSTGPRCLKIDPLNPKRIFGCGYGIFISTNEGESWSTFDFHGLSNLDTRDLTIDPWQSETLLASGIGISSYTRKIAAGGPEIEQIIPGSAPAGKRIVITGKNFGPAQPSSKVLFGNTPGGSARHWSENKISIVVPSNANTGSLTLEISGQKSNAPEFVVLPKPDKVRPAFGSRGTRVAISGFADRILFGQTVIRDCFPTVIHSQFITVCTAPPGNGTVDVVLSSTLVQTVKVGTFTYR